MPDLAIVVMARCASLDGVHDVGNYEVEIGPDAGQAGAHCTCPSFTFREGPRGDHCKHITQVREAGCTWNELIDGGQVKRGNPDRCPRCGSPQLDYFKAGV